MEKEKPKKPKIFGLVAKNSLHSFSKPYFTKKFAALQLENHHYLNFDIETISAFPKLLEKHPHIKGLNVTIPYKEKIIPYLDEIDETAAKIGAVNTILVTKNKLKGYNTDAYGFEKSIQPLLKSHHQKALLLGTGGASKAIAFTLKKLGFDYTFVSRNPVEKQFSYANLNKEIINTHHIIINCTPLGMHPNTNEKPPTPYQFITQKHLVYDLIYNPSETMFLKLAKEQKATICNGLKMLKLQAEKAWKIWNK